MDRKHHRVFIVRGCGSPSWLSQQTSRHDEARERPLSAPSAGVAMARAFPRSTFRYHERYSLRALFCGFSTMINQLDSSFSVVAPMLGAARPSNNGFHPTGGVGGGGG